MSRPMILSNFYPLWGLNDPSQLIYDMCMYTLELQMTLTYWDAFDDFRLQRLFSKKPNTISRKDTKKTDEIVVDSEMEDLFVERIRIENMELRFQLLYRT
ncbi:hypothetical protein BHE74_00036789 [Ensete ventricosum]|nr:hypothetical protein BHE74_00036789 [Ensete ventricosum]